MSKLRKLFNFMANGEERTSLEMQEEINTVCVGSRVADLRKRGQNVTC